MRRSGSAIDERRALLACAWGDNLAPQDAKRCEHPRLARSAKSHARRRATASPVAPAPATATATPTPTATATATPTPTPTAGIGVPGGAGIPPHMPEMGLRQGRTILAP